jgi:hypothetical protein
MTERTVCSAVREALERIERTRRHENERWKAIADEHMALVHPDGSDCPDGCDLAPYRGHVHEVQVRIQEHLNKLIDAVRADDRDAIRREFAILSFGREAKSGATLRTSSGPGYPAIVEVEDGTPLACDPSSETYWSM